MKLSQLINEQAFKDHLKVASGFRDSAGNLLARNLTQVDPTVFQVRYPDNTFLNSGLTIDNTGGYANQIQKIRLTGRGSFADSSDRGAGKGLITIGGEEDTISAIQREATIEYTDTEIEQAKLGNYNLVEKLFSAQFEIYNQEIDEILATGHRNGEGLLNYSGFTTDTGSAITTATTGQSDYDQIAGFITDQWNSVNNTRGYMANKIIMPTRVYNTISRKTYLPNAGTMKVLQALKEAFPEVEFTHSFRNEDVGGVTATVAYSNDRNAMLNRIPMALTVGKTVPMGSFGYKADSKYRIAGLDVAENSAGRILTGL